MLDDPAFLRGMYDRPGPGGGFAWTKVLERLQREPGRMEIDRHVVQTDAREG